MSNFPQCYIPQMAPNNDPHRLHHTSDISARDIRLMLRNSGFVCKQALEELDLGKTGEVKDSGLDSKLEEYTYDLFDSMAMFGYFIDYFDNNQVPFTVSKVGFYKGEVEGFGLNVVPAHNVELPQLSRDIAYTGNDITTLLKGDSSKIEGVNSQHEEHYQYDFNAEKSITGSISTFMHILSLATKDCTSADSALNTAKQLVEGTPSPLQILANMPQRFWAIAGKKGICFDVIKHDSKQNVVVADSFKTLQGAMIAGEIPKGYYHGGCPMRKHQTLNEFGQVFVAALERNIYSNIDSYLPATITNQPDR